MVDTTKPDPNNPLKTLDLRATIALELLKTLDRSTLSLNDTRRMIKQQFEIAGYFLELATILANSPEVTHE